MPMLNVESIRRRKAGPTRIKVADAAVRGLMLIVEPTGTKRFLLRYKAPEADGRVKDRKYALGTFGDGPGEISLDRARALASEWRERMKVGDYPHRVREAERHAVATAHAEAAAAPTVTSLIDLFRAKYLLPNTRRPDDRLVTAKKWLLDPDNGIGAMRLTEVRRRDLNALLDRMVAAGKPVAAASLGRLLGQMFRFAVDEELIDASPAEKLKKGGAHTPGDRVLTDDEIGRFWVALDQPGLRMSAATKHALRILLLTGARCGEMASARWENVQLTGREPVWTIPATSTKMARTHLVPLSKQAVAAFEALREFTGDTPWCLPAAERVRGPQRAGERDSVPEAHMEAHAFATALRRIQPIEGVAPFSAHDLRRTLRTGLSRLGYSVDVCEAVIGHVPRNRLIVTYDLYDKLPERRQALTEWGRDVAASVAATGRAGK